MKYEPKPKKEYDHGKRGTYYAPSWIKTKILYKIKEFSLPEPKTCFLCRSKPNTAWASIQAETPIEAATIYALKLLPRPKTVYVLYSDENPDVIEPLIVDMGDINYGSKRQLRKRLK